MLSYGQLCQYRILSPFSFPCLHPEHSGFRQAGNFRIFQSLLSGKTFYLLHELYNAFFLILLTTEYRILGTQKKKEYTEYKFIVLCAPFRFT